MSKDRIQKLLRKIGVLLQDDELSTLEKDLAKKYLIEIYDLIDDGMAQVKEKLDHKDLESKETRMRMENLQTPQAPQGEEQHVAAINNQVGDRQYKEEKIDPAPVTSFNSPVVPLEELPGKDNSLSEVKILPQAKPMPVEPLSEKAPLAVPPDFKRELSEVVTSVNFVPDKHKVLFNRDNQNELSDKLSLSPIADLRRALGINDKLLVVNELFKGDRESYQETIDVLNTKYSFADAQSYLVRYIIDKFDWLDEEKIDPAREFIKLVERRFLET